MLKTMLFRRLCLGLLLAQWLSPLASHAALPNPGGGGFNGQYNNYTFDNTNWLTSRAQSPVAFTNLLSVTGGDGNARRVDPSPGTKAFLCYHVVETNGATNIQLNLGSVAFWYRPHNWTSTNLGGSGPGEWSRFLEVGRDTNSSSWWSVFTDPGGGNIYFAAQTNTGSATYFLSAPIAFTSNNWHYIALTYASSQWVIPNNRFPGLTPEVLPSMPNPRHP